MQINDFSQLHQAVGQAIAMSRHQLLILSRAMEPRIFEQQDVMDSLKKLAIENRNAQIRLLVIDTTAMISGPHRLNDLIARLSSKIALRVPAPTDQGYSGAFMVADQKHCLLQDSGLLPEAELHMDDRRLARNWAGRFDEMWQRGLPDPNFRRLGI